MKIPQDYLRRVYAGWLGKVIGIRLGAPIEGWSYEMIRNTFGELNGYPASYKNFAADDDSNGPLFFIRALEDCGDIGRFDAQDVANALLNYAPFEHGFFWWGGYGVSTEHTAYLNLRNGIPAPRSGSIEQNGSTMAEQIGGQIFIDPWGLVAPGNPELAAKLAEKAASVTHGGNGVYGGVFIACCVSQAFVEKDVRTVMEKALAFIPADCEYTKVVRAVMDFYDRNPDNWRACFDFLHDNFGYDKYPGNCHIIPNAGVIALALLYGRGSYSDTINICNMCGWDTDCNVGNAGCIMGVLVGIEGIDYEKYAAPINDFLASSSVIGSLNATDLPFGASYFAKLGYMLAGEEPPKEWQGILNERIDSCHFEYPTSTHAIRGRSQSRFHILNTDEQANTGSRSLKITVFNGRPGSEHYFYKQTYYGPEDFDDSRYDPFFSPLCYPGQTVHMSVMLEQGKNGVEVFAQPYVKLGISGEILRGEKVSAAEPGWKELSLTIPAGLSDRVDETGVILSCTAKGFAMDPITAYLDDLYYDGRPDYKIDFNREGMSVWHNLHQDVHQFARLKGHTYLEDGWLSLSCGDFGEMYTGHYNWTDYSFEGTLKPLTGEDCFLNVRVQGAMRSYAAGFSKGRLVLDKNYYGYSTLCDREFAVEPGREYKVEVSACGDMLQVSVDGVKLLEHRDTDSPLLTGSVGVSVRGGSHCLYGSLSVRGHG